jgi:Ankyrin repeat.
MGKSNENIENQKLLFALKNNDLEGLKKALDNGADIKNSNSFGNTLLHYAVEKKNEDLIELFISVGCDINQTFRHDKDTPLALRLFSKK